MPTYHITATLTITAEDEDAATLCASSSLENLLGGDIHDISVDASKPADDDTGIAPGIAYALMLDTVFQGRILAERDGDNKPIVYVAKQSAERELADHRAIQYRQVADGERALADVADDEYVELVTIQMNGDIVDSSGRVIGNTHQPLPY